MKTDLFRSGLLSLNLLVLPVWAETDDSVLLPPQLNEVDIFAKNILNKAQALSFAKGKEFCGLIGFNQRDELVATEPAAGDANGCQPGGEQENIEVIASYHTHGSYTEAADTEAPSPDDLEADFAENIDGYVATPGGRLWLNLMELRETVLLCGPGCLATDPAYKPCKALLPKDSYTVQELKAREAEDDGSC